MSAGGADRICEMIGIAAGNTSGRNQEIETRRSFSDCGGDNVFIVGNDSEIHKLDGGRGKKRKKHRTIGVNNSSFDRFNTDIGKFVTRGKDANPQLSSDRSRGGASCSKHRDVPRIEPSAFLDNFRSLRDILSAAANIGAERGRELHHNRISRAVNMLFENDRRDASGDRSAREDANG
ncbi:MAG: hypothetical protein ABS35_21185 [Kaistia sp. SCN 65-12]|nr:MAG: hypothetical protein ABS35_21185 [Kaistia sp. SCN 65-12]